jgi:hypothetical protein
LTPSEKLTALAEERANSPENMQEMLALVIDRATSATIGQINYEIGHDVQLHPHRYRGCGRPRRENDYDRALTESQIIANFAKLNNGVSDYEALLREYVEMKLYLHTLRRSMYYPYDAYAEREGDFTQVLERCREIRAKIKELRSGFSEAQWGAFAPEPAATVNDKPLLYAMDDHQCSYFVTWDGDKEEWLQCQLTGEHWYAGLPYCRSHQGQARRDAKAQRRAKQQQARARHQAAHLSGDWSIAPEPILETCTYRDHYSGALCQMKCQHAHYGGRIERF